jgi:carbamoyltransferase
MFLLNQRTHRMLIRHDPDIGHVFVPNMRARIPGDEGGYSVVTNGVGFRSNFEFEKKRGALPRILMFGDSYTAGDDVCNEDRYSDRLGQLLNVEVQNYGISGTGTDQHLLAYKKFASSVEADLLIICVQIDSFHRIQVSSRPAVDRATGRALSIPKPYYELVEGKLKLRNVPVPIGRPESQVRESRGPGISEPDWYQRARNVYRQSNVLRKIRHSRPLEELSSQLISEIHRLTENQPYPDITSPDTAGWKLMKAILQEFIAAAKGIPVLIVPIPTKEFYVRGVRPMYQELFAMLDDPPNHVHVADVSTPLVGLPWRTRKLLHYEIGSHFTPLAHKLVSQELARCIRSRNLLPHSQPLSHMKQPAPSVSISARQQKPKYVLGISCFYHNSAASLIRDGEIVAAAEEERFSRVKNDRRFPHQAINYCLEAGGINQNDLAAAVYYDNSALTFERICHSMMSVDFEDARNMWANVMPHWLRTMLRTPDLIRKYLHYDGPILQGAHHRSHAASCFFASPFKRAAILTMDGVGEWATASIGAGKENNLRLLKEMHFPHSVGLLYSAFTHFTGFKVNSGEYKMMGLAPYGEPRYVDTILKNLVDLKEDGSIELNLSYFGFLNSQQMTNDAFAELFGGPRRKPESRITAREMDLARSVQVVTEEILLRMAKTARNLSGEKKLCLAGGVALNCVANGRLLREGPFDDIWIQPAAGDSGCALGAALDVYHSYFGEPRALRTDGRPLQGGSYLGPEFSDEEIRAYLETFGVSYRYLRGEERSKFLAQNLADGKIVGHFSGKLEYGPRSLGARSILGDPRNPTMQADLNLRIKFRESFRPFAPAVLAEDAPAYFNLDRESPYMLLVAPVKSERRIPATALGNSTADDLLPIVRQLRSDIPAVTHVDYSARVQTVRREDHAEFYDVIDAFRRKTGCSVLVNTSFNVRGEPIVCTPQNAHRCFARTNMDILALGNFIVLKSEQPDHSEMRGEDLEAEDPAESPEKHPEQFLKSINQLFEKKFWPVAQKLRLQKNVLINDSFRQISSTWVEANEPTNLRQLFEFPAALLQRDPSPAEFVKALTERWLGRTAAVELTPVLTRLMKEAFAFPDESEMDNKLSESVYAMY